MLHATSLLFGTNALHAHSKGLRLYALAFLMLMLSSVINHSTPQSSQSKKFILSCDYACIVFVVLVGQHYTFAMKNKRMMAVALALALSVALLHLNFLFQRVDFHEWVHVLSSLGHHVVMHGTPANFNSEQISKGLDGATSNKASGWSASNQAPPARSSTFGRSCRRRSNSESSAESGKKKKC